MKNKKIIIISILAIIVIIGIYVYNDYTRIIENVTNYSTGGKWAYSLNDTGSEVIYTLYQKIEPQVKNVTIYKIDNNIVEDITYEQHYTNKLNALNGSKQNITNATNVTVINNIVYYKPISSAEVGMTKDELMNNFTALEKIYNKII